MTAKKIHGESNVTALRRPPQSIEAEQSVLGGLMLVVDAWDSVADRITEDDFYRREHRLIFRAIGELATAGKPCDAVTLGEWFERQGDTASIGGGAYLAELANNTPSAANITAYANIVHDKSVLRSLIEVGTQIAGDGFNPDGRDTAAIVEAAEQRVFTLAEASARGREPVSSSKNALRELMTCLAARAANPGDLLGITTGSLDLDRRTLGLQPQSLVIVAGRPSMGKTAFALGVTEAAALRAKVPVLIFSMEMSRVDLMARMAASIARIDLQRLQRASDLTESEWDRVAKTASVLSTAEIFIDETPMLSPVEMRSRARRATREHGVGLVVVDYLQLMEVPGCKENRATEVAEISRSLKAMAKELNVPVVALSQLNRALEQRNDKRPVMSDLRESGAIEQDADMILLLYRDEVYDQESPDRGMAEIIIGKQRNGPIGTVRLLFRSDITRFENYTPDAGV